MASASGPAQREWVLDDAPAVLAFYNAHVAEVHRYISKLTGGDRTRTEDLTQEVFIALATAVRNGRVRAAHVGWLITTARRLFLHADRHDRREGRRLALVTGWRPRNRYDLDTPTAEDLVLRQAVGRLNDRERAALVLRYVDDLPVADVAALLGASVDATESLLARARRRLRGLIEEDE